MAVTGMANIAVKVADLDAACEFYRSAGAEVRDRMHWNNGERADVFLGPVMITLFTRAIYEDDVDLPAEGFLHPALFTDDLDRELEGHDVVWGPRSSRARSANGASRSCRHPATSGSSSWSSSNPGDDPVQRCFTDSMKAGGSSRAQVGRAGVAPARSGAGGRPRDRPLGRDRVRELVLRDPVRPQRRRARRPERPDLGHRPDPPRDDVGDRRGDPQRAELGGRVPRHPRRRHDR